MDLQLAGRTYLVTGGSRGIGRAVVEALLAEGAQVATCARDLDRLTTAYQELPAETRGRLHLYQCDVLDAVRLAEVVAEVAARCGRLDGVLANAGAGVAGTALQTDATTWTQQFDIKVTGLLNLIRPAVHWLNADRGAAAGAQGAASVVEGAASGTNRGTNRGAIVVINGVTAQAPESDLAAVSAARAAVRNLCLTLAADLAPLGIRVNTVNLGAIITDRQRDRYLRSRAQPPVAKQPPSDGQSPSDEEASFDGQASFDEWCDQEAVRRHIPLGRLGLPAEVAPTVLLLLSPLSSYTTGAVIDISGGLGARF